MPVTLQVTGHSPQILIDILHANINGLLYTPYITLINDKFDPNYYNSTVIVFNIVVTNVERYVDEDLVLNSFPNLLVLYCYGIKRTDYKKIPIILNDDRISDIKECLLQDHHCNFTSYS